VKHRPDRVIMQQVAAQIPRKPGFIKTPQDRPTIGLILCRGKNKTVVEYTLRDAKSPIGVAEYRLLPPRLKTQMPKADALKQLVAETEVPDEV